MIIIISSKLQTVRIPQKYRYPIESDMCNLFENFILFFMRGQCLTGKIISHYSLNSLLQFICLLSPRFMGKANARKI